MDDPEVILFNHNFQKDTLDKALDYVKDYIKKHKLILVGGQAIDYALRKKKSKLYDDNHLVDLDFYSSYHVKDAYDIGEALSDMFPDGNVSVINALHTSTMRVRINFQEVADITYVPEVLYKKLPTIMYDGYRIIHPHYQMIDQHRSLSLPFENPPFETALHRWKKDIVRYHLLKKFYPIVIDKKKKKITIAFNLLNMTYLKNYLN